MLRSTKNLKTFAYEYNPESSSDEGTEVYRVLAVVRYCTKNRLEHLSLDGDFYTDLPNDCTEALYCSYASFKS